MQRVTLDFSHSRNLDDMHQLVKRVLGFPDYYGKNLDALWDMLTGWIDTPVTIVIRGVEAMPAEMQEYAAEFVGVFLRAEEVYPAWFHIVRWGQQ